ncbi:hypothetical protein ES705_32957 [subsurface metagenome]
MKNIDKIPLLPKQKQSLNDLKQKLTQKFNIISLILFGSTARIESDSESDIDILIVTSKKFSRYERHQITDIVFEINLKNDTNLSTLVVDNDSWQNGPISVLPIRDEILRNGVVI